MAMPYRVCSLAGKATGVLLFATVMTLTGVAMAEDSETNGGSEVWLPSQITETPQEGFALAVTLSQKGVATTQPDVEVRKALRPEYAEDPGSLIAISHVIATHFQTVAAANGYWQE